MAVSEFFQLNNKLCLSTGHNADDIAETVIMNGKKHKVHVMYIVHDLTCINP